MVQFSGCDGASHVTNLSFKSDGATLSADDDDFRAITDPQGGAYNTLATSFLISLTAGQTVNPKLFVSGDTGFRYEKVSLLRFFSSVGSNKLANYNNISVIDEDLFFDVERTATDILKATDWTQLPDSGLTDNTV